MKKCVFCKLSNGEIPSSKIYDSDKIMGFLDIAPANKGHILIIPKKHYKTFIDIPEEELKEIMILAQKIAKAVICLKVDGKKVGGYNLLINNGAVAGQLIEHVHIHIIPRFIGDGINIGWPLLNGYNKEENEIEKYRKCYEEKLNEY